MNLLTSKWISVLRQNGAIDCISPCDLTDQIDINPIVELNSPRPDFNGAIAQFLIGLLQTALTNLKASDWRAWYAKPPTSSELKDLFLLLVPYFNLFGDGPRFMQDFESLGDVETKSISTLLIEQPGQQTLEQNKDIFIKRDQICLLCSACVAAALFTLQTNAPSGGAGHRTSMRGGGPLTTLVTSDKQEKFNLWQMLWLNILTKDQFENYTKYSLSLSEVQNKIIFPWTVSTITSKEKEEVRPSDVHPFQMYWGMPRRIRLLVMENCPKLCSLCGRSGEHMVAEYVTKNYGINYSEDWKHVLSPYQLTKENKFFPIHPQPGGIGYQHWLGLILNDNAAAVVKANNQRLLDEENENIESEIKVWAFGYDMDNMKARCWYESYMPLYKINRKFLERIQLNLPAFIDVTKQAKFYLSKALITCGISTKIANQQIWQQTEAKFYELLKEMFSLAVDLDNEQIIAIKQCWLEHVRRKALSIFEKLAYVQHAELHKMQKYVLTKDDLMKNLFGKKIRELLSF